MNHTRGMGWAAVLGAALIFVVGLGIADAMAEPTPNALPFLRTGVGARAYGLGNAYVALAGDATAGFFNPAGLSRIQKWGFATMLSADMGEARKFYYAAVGGSFNWGSVGVSWINAGTEVDKVDLTDPSAKTDYKDNYFLLSYGNCTGKMHYGASLVVANNSVAEETGVGGDLGVQWDFHPEARLGLVAQSLGLKVGDEVTPYNIRLGLAVMPEAINGLTFPVEVQKTQNVDDIKWRLGGEYAHAFDGSDYGAAVRGGVDDGAFAIGAGLRFKQFALDYAFVSEQQSFLGENHRFSLTGNF